ncbi:MAG: hypothetical protein Q8R47_00575 [Nanoarchaeota archaeon]|nr:hypothetical protein [Nanoarchaeota archaeon]
MNYRTNEHRNVLLEQYETAKAVLEELAEQKTNAFEHGATVIIESMGFRKSDVHGPATIYLRENGEKTEILSDIDLASWRHGVSYNASRTALHLYRIPGEQDFTSWYGSIPNPNKWMEENAKDAGIKGLAAMLTGATILGVIAAGNVPSLLIPSIAIGTFPGAFYGYLLAKKTCLDDQTLAKGPDALHYIATNTSFDDFAKYQAFKIESDVTNITEDSDIELIPQAEYDVIDVSDDPEVELIQDAIGRK